MPAHLATAACLAYVWFYIRCLTSYLALYERYPLASQWVLTGEALWSIVRLQGRSGMAGRMTILEVC
jgi:hypothetical protein